MQTVVAMKVRASTFFVAVVVIIAGAAGLIFAFWQKGDARISAVATEGGALSKDTTLGVAQPNVGADIATTMAPASTPARESSASEVRQPYTLSPGPRPLSDTIQDALARSDTSTALQLVRALVECIDLDAKQRAIDLERANPSSISGVTNLRIQEQSRQLTRSWSECQTLTADPKAHALQLAELAYTAGIPGAAPYLARLKSDRPESELFIRTAKDARGGDLVSLTASILGQRIPVSDAERVEMALALRGAFVKAISDGSGIDGSGIDIMFGAVADHYWNGTVSRTPGAPAEPRMDVFKRSGTFTLPPDLIMPTDPDAQARVAKLTEQLFRQAEQLERDRQDARRRAAGRQ
ncbi:MAG: hypothetical protein EKK53_09870 [Burkholderiales bacterium]|nr:MAG: hypothetical protein EKK53_09870 [Burkholderiales bacterium]